MQNAAFTTIATVPVTTLLVRWRSTRRGDGSRKAIWWEWQPHPVGTRTPKRSYVLFVGTGLVRNGLRGRFLPSSCQDFGYRLCEGHGWSNPPSNHAHSRVISRTVIAVDIAIQITRLLFWFHADQTSNGKHIEVKVFFSVGTCCDLHSCDTSTSPYCDAHLLTWSPSLLVLIAHK